MIKETLFLAILLLDLYLHHRWSRIGFILSTWLRLIFDSLNFFIIIITDYLINFRVSRVTIKTEIVILWMCDHRKVLYAALFYNVWRCSNLRVLYHITNHWVKIARSINLILVVFFVFLRWRCSWTCPDSQWHSIRLWWIIINLVMYIFLWRNFTF